jgi:hypothetical protein
MIDGKAIVLGPDGLSRFEELRLRSVAHADLARSTLSSTALARLL